MKVYLIIANWLLSFLLLTYDGGSIILTLLVSVYFSLSCILLNRYSRQVGKLIDKMNARIERFLISK